MHMILRGWEEEGRTNEDGVVVHRIIVRLHTPSYLTTRMDGTPRTHDVRACELLELAAVRAAAVVRSPSEAERIYSDAVRSHSAL